MRANQTRTPILTLAALLLSAAALDASIDTKLQPRSRVEQQVRKQIVKLPFYGVFDYIRFAVAGDRVTLRGAVSRPSLKRSAERVAIRVEGVREVDNRIEVLPLSSYDDRIRLATARALFSSPVLDRYGLHSIPPIHIIVRNGNVTLEGVVNREMERHVAGILANGVSGVFAVTNNLRVERR